MIPLSSVPEILADYPRFSLNTEFDTLPQCVYLDIDSLPTFVPENKLSILIFNVRSCRKNFSNFLCHFSEYVCKFTIIVLIETWLTEGISKLFPIHGFKYFDSFRSNLYINLDKISLCFKTYLLKMCKM